MSFIAQFVNHATYHNCLMYVHPVQQWDYFDMFLVEDEKVSCNGMIDVVENIIFYPSFCIAIHTALDMGGFCEIKESSLWMTSDVIDFFSDAWEYRFETNMTTTVILPQFVCEKKYRENDPIVRIAEEYFETQHD